MTLHKAAAVLLGLHAAALASALVLPSDSEGSAKVVLEAMVPGSRPVAGLTRD